MAKKKKPLKTRNPEAGKLQNPHFRKRVVPSKQKPEPKPTEEWE